MLIKIIFGRFKPLSAVQENKETNNDKVTKIARIFRFFFTFEHYFINVKKISQCLGKKVFINLLGYSNKLIKS